jgi:hypothetical protein
MKPVQLRFSALIDERGRAVLNELSWMPPDALPDEALQLTFLSVADWRFRPGTRLGQPYPVWVPLQVTYDPQGPVVEP